MKNYAIGGFVGILITIFILFCCTLLCCFSLFASIAGAFSTTSTTTTPISSMPTYSTVVGDGLSENKILRIKVNGIILNDAPQNPLFSLLSDEITYGYQVKQQFINATLDESIDAIILEVNSPGGTITGSQAIADGMNYFKQQTGKPVYGFGIGIIASGGYWAISGADNIYMDTGSSIGSIGVILGPIQTYKNVIGEGDVITTDGIDSTYFTGGKGKDFGNPYRGISDEEKSVYQKMIDDSYADFIAKVSTERGISEVELRNTIGAYLYGEDQALAYNLIDEVINRDDLLVKIATENNWGEDYQLIEELPTNDFFSSLFGVISNKEAVTHAKLICSHTESVLVVEQTTLKVCE